MPRNLSSQCSHFQAQIFAELAVLQTVTTKLSVIQEDGIPFMLMRPPVLSKFVAVDLDFVYVMSVYMKLNC
jgi:hypothetical protein